MAEKLFYSMGEVAEMFDVNASLIRHWESQFSILRPKRNKKGNRLFSPQDVENLKLIYHLVKERGMTLEGAKKALRQPRAGSGMRRDAELAERLQRIRALLVEVREDLKVTDEALVSAGDGEEGTQAAIPAATPVRQAAKVARDEDYAEGNCANKVPGDGSDAAAGGKNPASDAASAPRRRRKAVVHIDPAASGPQEEADASRPAVRRPRRKKEDAENKELFAFYEQSLF